MAEPGKVTHQIFSGMITKYDYYEKQKDGKTVYYIDFDIRFPKNGAKRPADMAITLTSHKESFSNQFRIGELLDFEVAIKDLKPKKEKYPAGLIGKKPQNCRITVFKKEVQEKTGEELFKKADVVFHPGMDSSKGKHYFYETGPKFMVYFFNEKEMNAFKEKYQSHPDIYEIYTPNYSIHKD